MKYFIMAKVLKHLNLHITNFRDIVCSGASINTDQSAIWRTFGDGASQACI